jgi:hypothetical protein
MSVRSVPSFRIAPLVALAVLGVAGCGGPSMSQQAPIPSSDALPIVHDPRAVVRMLPDRSLEVTTLVSDRGSRVHGLRIVTPEHREYEAILARTGPMTPGQQVGYLPDP